MTSESLGELWRHRLVVVTGKGGVGKTTVASLIGRRLAATGTATAVLEIDPRENAHRMLGVEPSGGALTPVDDDLWLQNVSPREVLDAVVREQLGVEMLARRVLDSQVYRHFATGCPGLEELAILGHSLRLLRGEAEAACSPEAVVLDAPATGHGLALLTAPGLVSDVVESGPFGRLAGELATFVEHPGEVGVVVVAAAETMPMDETLQLVDDLDERFGRGPDAVVVNGLYPPLPADPVPAGRRDRSTEVWYRRRRLNEDQLERLRRGWSGPVLELPLLPVARGPELVVALGEAIDGGVPTRRRQSGG